MLRDHRNHRGCVKKLIAISKISCHLAGVESTQDQICKIPFTKTVRVMMRFLSGFSTDAEII